LPVFLRQQRDQRCNENNICALSQRLSFISKQYCIRIEFFVLKFLAFVVGFKGPAVMEISEKRLTICEIEPTMEAKKLSSNSFCTATQSRRYP